jgi:3-oxoacyl-[acyl-carrier protein] reductase
MCEWKEKVVFISGGSRGIGRACALRFAKKGATVVLGYAGNEAAARETLALVEAAGARGKALKFDVASGDACAQAIEETVKEHSRLDVLVNNAGVAIDGLLVRVKEEDWERQFAVNVRGAFHLAKAACRPMMKQRSGAIVNITSVVGEMGNAGQAAYSATKAALIGFTKSLARELASRNIRVNAVAPGFIDTDMTQGLAGPSREKLLAGIPLSRLGTGDDVAAAVAFLASEEASYVTGEVLRVNGGLLT